jgi:hypothetical protein
MIRPLTDSPVVRIKYTSIAISANKYYALLSVFSNSLVVLHLTNSNEEEIIEESKPSNLSIQSTYKYYEHQVNSSLLILEGRKKQRIWHLDEEQNLITSEVVSKNGIVNIFSNEEFIHKDRSIIDVNYFSKDHIVLLMQYGLQFFNVKEKSLTTKIDTPGVTLISVLPLFNKEFEETIHLVGVSSHGECLKYDISHNKGDMNLLKMDTLSDSQTVVTSISKTDINKNKTALFFGTSYGCPSFYTFSKGNPEGERILKLKENYGNMKSLILHSNAITFCYGGNDPKIDKLESKTTKLQCEIDLNSALEQVKDPNSSFKNMRYFNPNQAIKDIFSKQGVNFNLQRDIILLMSTV